MKKMAYSSIILFLAGAMVVACGRKFKAMKGRSLSASVCTEQTVNGNLALADDLEAGAEMIRSQSFAGLFDTDEKQRRHNQLLTELAAIEFKILPGQNNTYKFRVRIAEQNCSNPTEFERAYQISDIANSILDMRIKGNYNVMLRCLGTPDTSNRTNQSLCKHYLVVVSKQYAPNSTGSLVTLISVDQSQEGHGSISTCRGNTIKYYSTLRSIKQVCTQTSPVTTTNGTGGSPYTPPTSGGTTGGGTTGGGSSGGGTTGGGTSGGGSGTIPPTIGGGQTTPGIDPNTPQFGLPSIFDTFDGTNFGDLIYVPTDPNNDVTTINPFPDALPPVIDNSPQTTIDPFQEFVPDNNNSVTPGTDGLNFVPINPETDDFFDT